jgi:hypothetical protein
MPINKRQNIRKKIVKIWLSLIIFCLGSNARTTTFIPISLDQQVESSNAAAEVQLINTKVFKNIENRITTEYEFKVISPINLEANNFKNGILKLNLPGGSLNGIHMVISGAPSFANNEKAFLLLKLVNNEAYLSNYSVGKFNIQKINGEEFLVNEVFPKTPGVGMIKKSAMIKKLEDRFKIETTKTILQSNESKAVNVNSATKQNIEKKLYKKTTEIKKEIVKDGIEIKVLSLVAMVLSLIVGFIWKRKNENKE